MTNNNNKTIYIAIGFVVLIAAIPFVMAILMFLGGFLFYTAHAN